MGNEVSSDRLDEERPPLESIENLNAFTLGSQSNSCSSRRSRTFQTMRARKRTRSQYTSRGDFSQPAGSFSEVGPSSTRWPIPGTPCSATASRISVGVSSTVAEGEGQLTIGETKNETDHLLHWTLNGRDYWPKPGDQLIRSVASSQFRIHPIGSRLSWKLSVAFKDHRDDSVSLYLESMNGIFGERFPLEVKFSMKIDSIAEQLDPISHTFSSLDPVYGVHNVASLDELKRFVCQNQYIKIDLCFSWVRDSMLFPSQFISLDSTHPELYQISESPKIFMLENFLNMEQCENLIEIAEPHLYRSRVASGTETPSRTSSSMFFTGKMSRIPLVRTIEEKLIDFVNLDGVASGISLIPAESLQCVKYKRGEFYAEHYDFRSGCSYLRAATLIVYLKDTEAGGATYFPKASTNLTNYETLPLSKKLRSDGLRVFPRRGRAILFFSRTAAREDDKQSLHAAEPIIMGEKWIATRWLREANA